MAKKKDDGPCKGQRAGSTDMDQLGEHEERIICPQCESEQLATVIHVSRTSSVRRGGSRSLHELVGQK